eukprot:TRINITY_DN72217_c0_g1_i1.p1 TRINITY_DN72217_c0_g1~~TRINITY_DN72217_c0_g1_i1.p1  ORF type:complete len:576 (+),score=64.80 TRINITY_DN72217_c0_g1_i1:124-1851(+)
MAQLQRFFLPTTSRINALTLGRTAFCRTRSQSWQHASAIRAVCTAALSVHARRVVLHNRKQHRSIAAHARASGKSASDEDVYVISMSLPRGEPLVRELDEAGYCAHLREACSPRNDFRIMDALANDVESVGDKLGVHRSGQHLQVWGEHMMNSQTFTVLVTHILAMFDLTLVDCWINLYRDGKDSKTPHFDNYWDRTPEPCVTIGMSFGQARHLSLMHAKTGKVQRVLQENGDVFAFDARFNRVYKHGVPPAGRPNGEVDGTRISVIIWATDQDMVGSMIRKRRPGQENIQRRVFWQNWNTSGHGSLSRYERSTDRAQEAMRGYQAMSGTCQVMKRLEELGVLQGGDSKVASVSSPDRDVLVAAAIETITEQIQAPDFGGKLSVEVWSQRFQPVLGSLRDFLESRADSFAVLPGHGQAYTVSLAKCATPASGVKIAGKRRSQPLGDPLPNMEGSAVEQGMRATPQADGACGALLGELVLEKEPLADSVTEACQDRLQADLGVVGNTSEAASAYNQICPKSKLRKASDTVAEEQREMDNTAQTLIGKASLDEHVTARTHSTSLFGLCMRRLTNYRN